MGTLVKFTFSLLAGLPASFVVTTAMAEPLAPTPWSGARPPFEIMDAAQSAGFMPLGRPERRGRIYVVHAADRYDRGVRVIVDADTARIVDVAPEVRDAPGYPPLPPAGPGLRYGPYEPMPPPDGSRQAALPPSPQPLSPQAATPRPPARKAAIPVPRPRNASAPAALPAPPDEAKPAEATPAETTSSIAGRPPVETPQAGSAPEAAPAPARPPADTPPASIPAPAQTNPAVSGNPPVETPMPPVTPLE